MHLGIDLARRVDRLGRRRWLAALLLAGAVGCGSSSTVEVGGTVTQAGKPLSGATVTFRPEGTTEGLGGSGMTNDEGKYTLTPARGKGLFPGEYRVIISRRLNPDGSPPDPSVPPMRSPASETLPAIYSGQKETILRATVSKEARDHPFDLKESAKGR